MDGDNFRCNTSKQLVVATDGCQTLARCKAAMRTLFLLGVLLTEKIFFFREWKLHVGRSPSQMACTTQKYALLSRTPVLAALGSVHAHVG
jgi:hypothetical protein